MRCRVTASCLVCMTTTKLYLYSTFLKRQHNHVCNCTAEPCCLTAKDQHLFLGMSKPTVVAAATMWGGDPDLCSCSLPRPRGTAGLRRSFRLSRKDRQGSSGEGSEAGDSDYLTYEEVSRYQQRSHERPRLVVLIGRRTGGWVSYENVLHMYYASITSVMFVVPEILLTSSGM